MTSPEIPDAAVEARNSITESCGCVFCDLNLPPNAMVDGKPAHASKDRYSICPTETKRADLAEKLCASKERVDAMTPAEREAMLSEQAESWARSCAPCEHGIRDWETCPDCRAAALASAPVKGGE